MSWYQVTSAHPCYDEALGWSNGYTDVDFIRGFCFCWDALGGHTVKYSDKTINVGGDLNPLYMNIGSGVDAFLYQEYLASSIIFNNAQQIESVYLPTITSPSQYRFYQGYIMCLYQVSYSPTILEISRGNSM